MKFKKVDKFFNGPELLLPFCLLQESRQTNINHTRHFNGENRPNNSEPRPISFFSYKCKELLSLTILLSMTVK